MTDDQAYNLQIIKKFITSYLDENIPNNETGLIMLVDQCDDIVWKIASKIYTESGHKVDFHVIRNVIKNRVKFSPINIDKIKDDERRKIKSEKLKAQRLVEKRKIYEENKDKILSDLFLDVKDIISEDLDVEVNKITLDSNLAHDLGADFLDFVELIMRLEEHFEIDFSGTRLDIDSFGNYFVINYSPDDINCTVFQLIDCIGKKLYF